MREVARSNPVIGKDFLHFLFFIPYFKRANRLVKTEIQGIHDNKLFDTKHYRQPNNCECFNYHTPYSPTLVRICFANAKPKTNTNNMETTIDKIVL